MARRLVNDWKYCKAGNGVKISPRNGYDLGDEFSGRIRVWILHGILCVTPPAECLTISRYEQFWMPLLFRTFMAFVLMWCPLRKRIYWTFAWQFLSIVASPSSFSASFAIFPLFLVHPSLLFNLFHYFAFSPFFIISTLISSYRRFFLPLLLSFFLPFFHYSLFFLYANKCTFLCKYSCFAV